MAEDLIRMENISKLYGRVQALDEVTFAGLRDTRSSDCSATTAPASRR